MGSNWKRWKAIVITFERNGNLCNGVLMNLCTQVLRNSKKDTIEKYKHNYIGSGELRLAEQNPNITSD
ncbi:hypothetical protein FHS86_003039 [Roseimarinus sediminis]